MSFMMFAQERQKAILALLTGESRVEVAALARRFKVSEDTVRRDLRGLAAAGYLQKTHGGAVALDVASLAWEARSNVQPAAKTKIGVAAAGLVAAQETVIIDAGLTVLEFAKHLSARPLTVVTNSLDVARQFEGDSAVSLAVTGGQWDPSARYLSGEQALKSLSLVRADWVFLGTCALHPEAGMTAKHAADADMKRAMLRAGLRAVLLADHSKFGKLAPHFVGPLASLHAIVTDVPAKWLSSKGPRVILA
jgi:DeoR/GlpR family transcriptional regulator of sugar metabolism